MPKWSGPTGSCRATASFTHWATPIYHEGYFYVSSGRHSGNAELRAVEHRTGKVMWSEPELTRSTLLYADGHFLVLSDRGTLALIQATPEKYKQLSKIKVLSGRCWTVPTLVGGKLYLRNEKEIVAYDLGGSI